MPNLSVERNVTYSNKEDYFDMPHKEDYFDMPHKEDYFDMPHKEDYFDMPHKEDYFDMPHKEDYFDMPHKEDYFDMPHKEDYFDMPHKEDYFDMPRNDTKSAINALYSITAINTMIKSIKQEAGKMFKFPQEKCKRRLPQCLIIGNYKCGTRELIDYMSMHPRIVIKSKPFYEISFFSRKYERGLDWYKHNMPCSFSYQITVEKSPNYFHNVNVPARIHQMNASIKLIALVREPVARAISQFTFKETRLDKFDYNLDECVLKQPGGDINTNCKVVRESIYDEGLKRYLRFFKKSQIKIIEAEYFKRKPYNVLREIEEYLNIEHVIKPDNFVYVEQKGVFCLRKAKQSESASCYGAERGRNTTQVKNSIKYSNMTLHKLKSFFKPHNDEFFKLINRTFDW